MNEFELCRFHEILIKSVEVNESYIKFKFDTHLYTNVGLPKEQELKIPFKTIKKKDLEKINSVFGVKEFKDLKGKKAMLTYYLAPDKKLYVSSITAEENKETAFSLADFSIIR